MSCHRRKTWMGLKICYVWLSKKCDPTKTGKMIGSPYQPKTILRVSLPLSGKYSHTHTHIFTKYPLPYSNFSVLESGKLTRLFQGQWINLIYMKAECVTEPYTHIQWSYLIPQTTWRPTVWESPDKKRREREKEVQGGRMGGRETQKKRNDRWDSKEMETLEDKFLPENGFWWTRFIQLSSLSEVSLLSLGLRTNELTYLL